MMKNLNKELMFLRTFAVSSVAAIVQLTTTGFSNNNHNKFASIDVERINIIEPDGTVKMIITNVDKFPNGKEIINDRPTNEKRKKRSGMLFYNEDGIEAGGFIYDGRKNEQGHSSGLSLTYDQYGGDQVMQLINTDIERNGKRIVSSSLVFNDRAENETQESTARIMAEIRAINDKKLRKQKYDEYEKQGLIGSSTRVMLGKTRSENNGLFLFGKDGSIRGMFYVDKNDQAKFEIYGDNGELKSSWPTTK